MGQGGFENHWFYFPAVLILKSPTPFLLALALGIGLGLTGKVRIPAWNWIPPFFLLLALLPTLNEGIRFLLPALPFAFLVAARGSAWLWNWEIGAARPGLGRSLVLLLLVWLVVGTASVFPHYLSAFNEFIPSEKKMFFLADSNLDWSQDHRRLAEESRAKGWKRVKLAYLGGVDPGVYGLAWEPWRESDLAKPQPGWTYLVNASFFQLAPIFYPETRPIATGWISRRIPTGKIADSWYFFEIQGEPVATDPRDPILASVPFQQKRGYTPFPPEGGR